MRVCEKNIREATHVYRLRVQLRRYEGESFRRTLFSNTPADPSLDPELVQFLKEPVVAGSLVAGPLLVDAHPAHRVGPRRVLGADEGVCARAELLLDAPRGEV